MKKSLLLFMSVLSFALTACGNSQEDYNVRLNKNTLDLEVDESETLSVVITPNDLKNPHLVWSVDSSIATIEEGFVTALAQGRSDIKVFLDLNSNMFYDDGEPFDVCHLTVSELEILRVTVTSIALNETALSLELNNEVTLTATILPTNATEKSIVWVSNNPDVATVNNGKVVALSVGGATITAYVDENLNSAHDANEKYATCLVTVLGPTPEPTVWVTSVEISATSISIEEGSFETLSATVLPSNATYKTVTWVSSNNSIATVASGKVSGVKAGTAVITAYVDENRNATLDSDDKRATVSVTVTAKKVDPNPSEDPIPARGENLPIGNTSVSGPNNTKPDDITDWVNYDLYSSLPPYWSFIMGNNKVKSADFYAESAGGGFKFSHLNYGIQSPLLNSWLKTEVRLTVSAVTNNSKNANDHKNKPIFHIYSYDSDGYYLGVDTFAQLSSFANTKELIFYIRKPKMAYFEIRLNAFPCKSSQCYNFGVSQISLKGWPYP